MKNAKCKVQNAEGGVPVARLRTSGILHFALCIPHSEQAALVLPQAS